MRNNNAKTIKLVTAVLPIQNKNIKQNSAALSPLAGSMVCGENLNQEGKLSWPAAAQAGTTTSLIKKSFNKYLNLTSYSNKLTLFPSNIRKDKNEIILNTKKEKDSVSISNLVIKKNKSLFERVDMLNYSKVEKLRRRIKKTKIALSLAPSSSGQRVNTILNNYLGFGPKSAKMNFDICHSQNLIYQFKKLRPQANRFVATILENSFITMHSLISRPIFNITPQKVVIHLFFFLVNNSLKKSKFLSLNSKILELLCANLSKYFKKPVELNLIRLHSPINDSNILANVLGRICETSTIPYIFILEKIFNRAKIKNSTIQASPPKSNSFIPSFITGIKIKLAGRLLRNKIIPRHTVKTTQHGSLTRSSAEIVSKARFTTKNKRGTFSFTTSIGHRFF